MQRTLLIASIAIATLALGFAFLLEHGFGMEPCNLCWWQRYPYMAILPIGLALLVLGYVGSGVVVVALLFLASAGVAWYHGGVEAGLFALPEGCSAVGNAKSIEELRAEIFSSRPSCDQVSFRFLGLSLSVWNAIFATGMGLVLLTLPVWASFKQTSKETPA